MPLRYLPEDTKMLSQYLQPRSRRARIRSEMSREAIDQEKSGLIGRSFQLIMAYGTIANHLLSSYTMVRLVVPPGSSPVVSKIEERGASILMALEDLS